MPPHGPFDAVITGALPYRHRVSWTQLDTPEGYRGLVSVAKTVAGAVPLAEWELREYQRRAPPARRDRRRLRVRRALDFPVGRHHQGAPNGL